MRNLILFLMLLTYPWVFAQLPSSTKSLIFDIEYKIKKNTNKHFPEFSIYSTDSVHFSNHNLQGKVTFINFWFAGCTPCMAEMSELNHLFDKFRINNDFQYLSITKDRIDIAKNSILNLQMKYPVCCVESDIASNLNFGLGYPVSIIIDRKGDVVLIKAGGALNKEGVLQNMKELEKKIEEVLVEPTSIVTSHSLNNKLQQTSTENKLKDSDTNMILNGRVYGIDNAPLYIKTYNEESEYRYDTVQITNGLFRYSACIKEPKNIILKTNDNRSLGDCWIEPGNLDAIIKIDSSFFKFGIKNVFRCHLNNSKTQKGQDEFETFRAKNKSEDANDKFISIHHSSFISLVALNELVEKYKNNVERIHQLDSLYKELDLELKNTPSGQYIERTIQGITESQTGRPAPDFEVPDSEGKIVRLSSFRNNSVVLLDFWTPYCIPCKHGFTANRELLKKYSNNGLKIITINIDNDREKWLSSILLNQLEPFVNIHDNTKKIYAKYNVGAVPRYVLVDRNGIIKGVWVGFSQQVDGEIRALIAKLVDA